MATTAPVSTWWTTGGRAEMEAAFLILLFSGVGALIAGMLWTRVNWRPDVPPYRRGTHFLDVTLHPERYATGESVRAIRTMNAAGALLVVAAVIVVGYMVLKVQFRF